jgi:hypothetical protein
MLSFLQETNVKRQTIDMINLYGIYFLLFQAKSIT